MQVQSNNLKLFLKSQGVFFSLSVLLRNHCWFCILYHTGRQKHFLLTFLKRKMNSASIVLKYKYYFSLSGEEISSPFWFFGELQLVFLSFFFKKKKKCHSTLHICYQELWLWIYLLLLDVYTVLSFSCLHLCSSYS